MRKLMSILVLLSFSTLTYGTIDKEENTNTSSNIVQPLSVESDQYYAVDNNPNWFNDFKIKGVKNEIIFGIDESILTIDPAFEYLITFDVSWEELQSNNTLQTQTTSVELEVDFDPTLQYKDRSVYTFNNGLQVNISSVQLFIKNSSQVYVPVTTYPSNLFLKATVETEYYDVFDRFTVPSVSSTDINLSYNINEAKLQVDWSNISGAEEYELEWIWVHSYTGTVTGGNVQLHTPNHVHYNFNENASRVRLKESNYDIPLIYGNGFLLVRYRGIGIGGPNLNVPIEGAWSGVPVSGMVSQCPNTCYTATTPLENNAFNYAAQMGFVENGAKGVTVQYMDGTAKTRQTISKMNSQDEVIGGSTVYDYYGRPAIQTMGSPVKQAHLNYIDGINLDLSGDVYDKDDFHKDNLMYGDCGVKPAPPMHELESKGVANYYSDQNTDQDGAEAYLPDADGYTFIQTHYANDPTSRAKRVGGVGATHQLEEGMHYKETIYENVKGNETTYLFGSDAAPAHNYTRVITRDANGQVSVTILDSYGQTVATYLEGEAPAGLEAIEGNDGPTLLHTQLFNDNNPNLEEEGVLSVQTLIAVTDPNTLYTFNYDFEQQVYTNCLPANMCFDCVYEITYSITPEEGEFSASCGPVNENEVAYDAPYSWTHTVGMIDETNYNTTCDPAITFSSVNPGSFGIQFPRFGSYYVTKTLKVSQAPVDYYWEQYVENSTCLTPYSEFLQNELSTIDYSLCESLTACEQNFLDHFGTWTVYLANNPGATQQQYEDEKEEFIIDCENAPICEQLKPILMGDVTPGGQYGSLDPTDPLSVFNTNNSLEIHWQSAGLNYTTNGQPSLIQNSLGNMVSPLDPSITLTDFLNNWQQEWAEALIVGHPEYITYTFCTTFPEVFSYAANFNNTETMADAITNDFLNPMGSANYSCFSSAPAGTLQDPLITLFDESTDLIYQNLNDRTYAYYMNGQQTWTYLQQAQALLNDCSGSSLYQQVSLMTDGEPFGQSTCDNDKHWLSFRNMYMGRRNILLQVVMEGWAMLQVTNGNPNQNHIRCINFVNTSHCVSPHDYENKIKRFPLFDQMMANPYLEVVSNPSVANPGSAPSIDFCETQCEALSDTWMSSLEGCATLLNVSPQDWASGNSVYDALQVDLENVCKGGCSPEWPVASQFSDNPSPYASFEEVLTSSAYLNGPETATCSHLLINFPQPVDDLSLIHELNECGCDQLLSVDNEEDFVAQYGFYPANFCNDRAECANAAGVSTGETYCDECPEPAIEWTQSQLGALSLIETLNDYKCAGEDCIDCEVITDAVAHLNSIFGITDVTLHPSIFTNYINETQSTNFNYASLEAFMQTCDDYVNGVTTSGFSNGVNDLVDILNGLTAAGITNGQSHYGNTLPAYFTASFTTLKPSCEVDPTIAYNYSPQIVGSTLTFGINHSTCDFCDRNESITLELINQGSFNTALEAMQATTSFGAPYWNSSLATNQFAIDAIALDDQNNEVELTYYVRTTCFDILPGAGPTGPNAPILCVNYDFHNDPQPDCIDGLIANATINADEAYAHYLTEQQEIFEANYIETCLNVTEDHSYDYKANRYHYTLFYYDRVGNLVKTVPPKGVNPLDVNDVTDIVENGAEIYPEHTYASTYQFNSMNQQILSNTPDGGDTKSWYDDLGRPVVSQNARQAEFNTKLLNNDPFGSGVNVPTYNYIKYDYLGRIAESAEIMQPTPMDNNTAKNAHALRQWIDPVNASGTAKSQINKVVYSTPQSAAAELEFGGDGYGDIRNRIAATEKYEGWFTPSFGVIDIGTPDYVNHNSYDVHGVVKTYLSQNKDLAADNREFVRTDYTYDLISELTHQIDYQKGKIDQMSHRYVYDADNRIKEIYTSKDGIIWDKDADYQYRLDGMLARTELGEMQVQGCDFVYTLHGWIRGMNSAVLDPNKDMGKDGISTAYPYESGSPIAHEYIARDAFAFTLGYYEGDYKRVSHLETGKEWDMNIASTPFEADLKPLYNGNIQYMSTALSDLDANPLDVHASTYQYDQLQRFKENHEFTANDITALNSMANATRKNVSTSAQLNALGNYDVHVDYDPNGNILNLGRRTYASAANNNDNLMDLFTYNYHVDLTDPLNPKPTNQLADVEDVAPGVVNYGDIMGTQTSGNYTYHADGSLKSDAAEEIAYIQWYPDGKVKRIYRTAGSTKPDSYFEYDSKGVRCLKVVMTKDGSGNMNPSNLWSYSWYGMDAQDNTLAIYEKTEAEEELTIKERFMIGSKRLGLDTRSAKVSDPVTPYKDRILGAKFFELGDHRANVQQVISDRKVAIGNGNGEVDYFVTDVQSFADYYPFGMVMASCSGEMTEEVITLEEVSEAVIYTNMNYKTQPVSFVNTDGDLENIQGSNGRGSSVQTLNAGDWIEWNASVIPNNRTFVGLSYADLNGGFETINYAWYVYPNGKAYIYESGVPIGFQTTYSQGSVFKIARENENIIYSVDGVVYRTVADANTNTTMLVDITLVDISGVGVKVENLTIHRMENVTSVISVPCVARSGSKNSYRYGFQGQEKDDEIKGSNYSVNYKYRMHDPRLGRFFAVDPLAPKYPHNSPYAFSENRLMDGVELEGLEYVGDNEITGMSILTTYNPDGTVKSTQSTTYSTTTWHYRPDILTAEDAKKLGFDDYIGIDEKRTYHSEENGGGTNTIYGNDPNGSHWVPDNPEVPKSIVNNYMDQYEYNFGVGLDGDIINKYCGMNFLGNDFTAESLQWTDNEQFIEIIWWTCAGSLALASGGALVSTMPAGSGAAIVEFGKDAYWFVGGAYGTAQAEIAATTAYILNSTTYGPALLASAQLILDMKALENQKTSSTSILPFNLDEKLVKDIMESLGSKKTK